MKKKLIFLFLVQLFIPDLLRELSKQYYHERLQKEMVSKFGHLEPTKFSEWHKNVIRKIDTDEKIIALTFDACGGKHGSGYNKRLIDLLIKHNIQSTLFISGRWIDVNLKIFLKLAANPLFDIENHGLEHRICSVKGLKVYSVKSTNNINEVVDEVELNALKIEKLTGKKPLFYRSGTAFYDDVAVKIIYKLGYIPVNFSGVPGDTNTKASLQKLTRNILNMAKKGAILIFHFNQPQYKTAQALEKAIPILKAKGFRFVKLIHYKYSLK